MDDRRCWLASVALGMLAMSASAEAQERPRFALREGCSLPFARIAPTRDALEICDNAGRMAGTSPPPRAERLRLDAMNNLCAPAARPTVVGFEDLARLPAPGSSTVAVDRSRLMHVTTVRGTPVGEGLVVRLVGQVRKAHIAGCPAASGGTPVGKASTCHMLLGAGTSEIQLRLVPLEAGALACADVVATVIPHFRPVWWGGIDIRTPVPPVRITGQLFYDDTAIVCEPGHGGKPGGTGNGRLTKWDIHPVYAIDVCTNENPALCRALDDGAWISYDVWLQQGEPAVQATGAEERALCETASLKWKSEQARRLR